MTFWENVFLDAEKKTATGLMGCAGAGEDFWRGTRTSKTWKKRTWRQELGAKSWAKNWASWVLKFGTPTPEGRRIRQRRIPPARHSTRRTIGQNKNLKKTKKDEQAKKPTAIRRNFFEAWGSFCDHFVSLGDHLLPMVLTDLQ